jgi:hypothetical protein
MVILLLTIGKLVINTIILLDILNNKKLITI